MTITAITPDTVFADVETLAEAKLIVRDVRLTAIAVESKYGPDHSITKMFSERYDSYLDALAFYANKKAFAA